MSVDGNPAPVDRRLGYVLKRAQQALRTSMDEELRPLGLTSPQYAVLSALDLEPGISSAALARAAFVTPQTMHGIVANLAKEGLLRREADPEHGRILRSVLTSRGAGALRRAHDVVNAVEARMTASLSREKQAELAAGLALCAESLSRGDG
jgi:DNA-binding MarR family transcriptional regulator